jgi:hypothetical protein
MNSSMNNLTSNQEICWFHSKDMWLLISDKELIKLKEDNNCLRLCLDKLIQMMKIQLFRERISIQREEEKH